MISSSRVQIFFGLIESAHGYSKFVTHCSTPTQEMNFVSSPDTRGTLDILWSCLFTIFACTWTIQHLNVPEQRNNRDPGTLGDIKWSLKGVWKTTKWMLITILAPELILGKAFADLIAARSNNKKMKGFAEQDGVEWGLSHSFFANMGGFMVRSKPATRPEEALSTADPVSTPSKEEEQEKEDIPLAVLGLTLHQLRSEKHISRLPDITAAELSDKSKGSVFIKAIAMGQVLWNITQIVARVSRGLAITQLELATAAFSVCAIITYFLLLYKPQGIQSPVRPIDCWVDNFKVWVSKRNAVNATSCTDVGTPASRSERLPWTSIPNDILDAKFGPRFFYGSTAGGIIFGAIHLLGWNLTFRNSLELLVWRIASAYITGSLLVLTPVVVVLTSLNSLLSSKIGDISGRLLMSCSVVIFPLYVVARLFLLVEYCRTLFFLPPDAYISTWASSIPHIA